MRQLLERWAELEPDKCKHEVIAGNNWISVWLNEWEIAYSDSPHSSISENGQKMRIQWAVQEAIVSRNWSLETYYYSFQDGWRVVVKNGVISFASGGSNQVEVLLSAYIKALEGEAKR